MVSTVESPAQRDLFTALIQIAVQVILVEVLGKRFTRQPQRVVVSLLPPPQRAQTGEHRSDGPALVTSARELERLRQDRLSLLEPALLQQRLCVGISGGTLNPRSRRRSVRHR